MTMKFGGKQTMADKMKVAERYKPSGPSSASKTPKAKVTVKPTGGLIPKGVKVKVEQKFKSGKWVR